MEDTTTISTTWHCKAGMLVAGVWSLFILPSIFAGENQEPAGRSPGVSLPVQNSPYAVCAHISRGGEHEIAREELRIMSEAGIAWVRTDFDWSGVEKKQGEWTFDHLDETVKWAEEAGVTILPILDYDVNWARPAHKHLDEWTEYVRQVVTRYKDRIRCWEIWNEPNLKGAWRDEPDPVAYTTLLQAAYTQIKAIDPDLTVLLGGMAGIPWEFIEGIYQADGGKCFDAMNIHPYRYPASPESGKLYEDLQKLRELMSRYGDGEKPIWITEIGWPTHSSPISLGALMGGIIRAGLKAIDPSRENWTAALLDDPDYPGGFTPETAESAKIMLQPAPVHTVSIADLPNLDPGTTRILVLPPEEGFPAVGFDAIEQFVRNGGVVVLWSGVPLYYAVRQKPDGTWERPHAGEEFRQRLRIGWEAWWTKEGVPEKVKTSIPADEWKDTISLPEHMPEATRFLNDSALKPGDRFFPLVYSSGKDYRGVSAAAYALNSDLKGGVIVSTFTGFGRNVTPEHQGMICPRAYLIALQAGISRLFWYEFQAPERDPFYNEHHFGMVHRDLSPKPAYTALQALTRARPAGSLPGTGPWRSDDETLYFPHWQSADGKTAWALWRIKGKGTYVLNITGPVEASFDHLGNAHALDVRNGTAKVELDESILYLVGPSQVTVAPAETP